MTVSKGLGFRAYKPSAEEKDLVDVLRQKGSQNMNIPFPLSGQLHGQKLTAIQWALRLGTAVLVDRIATLKCVDLELRGRNSYFESLHLDRYDLFDILIVKRKIIRFNTELVQLSLEHENIAYLTTLLNKRPDLEITSEIEEAAQQASEPKARLIQEYQKKQREPFIPQPWKKVRGQLAPRKLPSDEKPLNIVTLMFQALDGDETAMSLLRAMMR
jgi:hypothetical protein